MVQTVVWTIVIPQLLVDKVVDAPVVQDVQVSQAHHPYRDAEADPRNPGCLADHKDFAVAVRLQVVAGCEETLILAAPRNRSGPRGSASSSGAWVTVVIPLLQIVENSTLASMKSAEAPQLSFIEEGPAHGRDELMG